MFLCYIGLFYFSDMHQVEIALSVPFKIGVRFLSVGSGSQTQSTSQFGQTKQIPGPFALPFFGSLYDYRLGSLSKFSPGEYARALQQRYEKYGPISHECLGGSTKIVHIFDPEDARTIFSSEDRTPEIKPLQETAQLYRSHRNLTLGLGNMNGDEWYRLRQSVQQLMMQPRAVRNFLPLSVTVAQDFVHHLLQYRGWNLVKSVRQWSLESSANLVVEKRLGAIGAVADSSVQKMIDCNQEFFYLSGLLKFSLPFYKMFSSLSPKWRKLVKAEDYFFMQARSLFEDAIREIRSRLDSNDLAPDRFAFLQYMLSKESLSDEDIIIICFSLFSDGLNTTAPTLVYALYCLATHVAAQDRARAEVDSILSDDSDLTTEKLNRLQFIRACVKETMRLYPIGTEVSRVLKKDLVLSGYPVPAGTPVDISMNVHLRSSQYFKDPDSFIPERWLRGENTADTPHPFVMIPFGHGPRMCAGRRFAEQDLFVAIALILQKLQIKHLGGKMEQTMESLLLPAGDWELEFIPRGAN